jgi:cytidylate kinase
MQVKVKPVAQIVEDQVRSWHFRRSEPKQVKKTIPMLTISREPGSGGRIIGEKLAQRLGFDLFHQEVLHEMARSAKVSAQLLETLDEKGLSVLDNWIASLVDTRHLWPDQYLKHLMKVIGTIGRHGSAILIGRGANFILPAEQRLSVRVIAPLEMRARKVAEAYDLSVEDARRRVTKTDSERKAFIRKYFYADIADPLNYDVTVNTGSMSLDGAVDVVCSTLDVCRMRCEAGEGATEKVSALA